VAFQPVEAKPNVYASSACAPARVTLSQPIDTHLLSYTWYLDGLPVSGAASHVMDFSAGTTHDVALVVKGQDGCMDSTYMGQAIQVAAPVVAQARASDTAVCVGQPIELMPTHTGHTGQAIYWGDGALDTVLNTRSHAFSKPGLYQVKVLATNSIFNCADTQVLQVKAFGIPQAEFSIKTEGACVPQMVEMDNRSKGKFTSMVLIMDQYDTLSFDDALLLRDPGTYEFRLSLANGLPTCKSEYVATLDLVSPLSAEQQVTISQISSQNGAFHLQWKGVDKMTTYEINLVQAEGFTPLAVVEDTQYQWVPLPGLDSFPAFSVRGMDACGAFSNYSHPAGAIALSGHYQTDSLPTLSWTPFTAWGESLAYYEIQKDLGDGWIPVGISGQPHYIDRDFNKQETMEARYRVVAIHVNGTWNSASTEYSFDYVSDIFIPTAFSPNYDNVNDIYEIVGTGMGKLQVQIFNRWGQKVYDNEGEKPQWDGKFQGNLAEAGTYICVVDMESPNGRSFNYQKAITLIR
jgi:gliding motility-associated-like protein